MSIYLYLESFSSPKSNLFPLSVWQSLERFMETTCNKSLFPYFHVSAKGCNMKQRMGNRKHIMKTKQVA